MRIGAKDSEARKLERYEQKILKRLKLTHLKQQDAIEQIQGIFNTHQNHQVMVTNNDNDTLNNSLLELEENSTSVAQSQSNNLHYQNHNFD